MPRRPRLDRDAAEAIVRGDGNGSAGADRVPEGYEEVAELLGRLRPPRDRVEADPVVVTRMQGVLGELVAPRGRGDGRRLGAIIAFAVAGGALIGGLAAANALPGPVVSDALGTIGIAGAANGDPVSEPSVGTARRHTSQAGDDPSVDLTTDTPTIAATPAIPPVPDGGVPGITAPPTSPPSPPSPAIQSTLPPPAAPDIPPGHTPDHGSGGTSDPQPDHGNDSKGHGGGTDPQPDHGSDHGGSSGGGGPQN